MISYAMIGALLALMLALQWVPNRPARQINSVVPVIDSIMFLSDLVTATLLYVQATVFRSRALMFLASSFVFIALLLLVHMLSFPGAFAPAGVVGGGVNTTGWAYLFRRAAFPLAVIVYIALRRSDSDPTVDRYPVKVWWWVLSAICAFGGAAVLLTAGHEWLPPLFSDRLVIIRSQIVLIDLALIGLTLAAALMLFACRRSVLDMWLLVALAAWFVELPLNLRQVARFTVAFYLEFAVMPLWTLILMLALIAESSRLYTRLALSTAAQQRERDARLLSVDAMAATFSHEIGQPLSAVSVNATAGLNWLNAVPPNVDKAAEALRGALEATRRTLSVTKSLRTMLARGPATVTQFRINDLVWQTTTLLHRELAAERVALRLQLDNSLPPIVADRVQIQQVLINLLMNAIESLSEVRGRQRQITINSAMLDGRAITVEVRDTGAGIDPEDLERIFEPLVTTKSTGTGLGLPICRAIVEDHGGRLWASHERPGAAFHLQLPCGSALA